MKGLKFIIFAMVLVVFLFSLSNILHANMSATGWLYNICAACCSVAYLWFNIK